MNTRTSRLHAFASVVSVLGLMGLASAGGCSDVAAIAEGCDSDFTAQASWGANLDIDNRVKTFMGASGALVTLSSAMLNDVTDACIGIATAANPDTSKWEALKGTERLEAACAEANTRMKAILDANSMITIGLLVEGGGCQASLTATSDCYARCDASATCTPAQLEAKCEPGRLAGGCSAQCTGACTAKVGATVACNGGCSSTCQGTCTASAGSTGMCSRYDANNNCDGRCDGVCNGTCSGRCDYQAGAMASCDGTCSGTCSVEFQEPYCEGKLTPPECMLDADCEASCRTQVQAEASCTPPTVKLQFATGAPDDFTKLMAALETHLPKLIQNIGVRGEATIDAANTLVDVSQNLKGAITSSGKALVCTTVAASAALNASVEVQVSVKASVDIGATAGASAQ